ncbi:MAG TPA: prolyl oligopeptidase family serine peptidase [Candidatus Angelobacter sp.]|nr:prolyl oligopeptidase family serine peptidase [Candidatus Angelobacter sp.]
MDWRDRFRAGLVTGVSRAREHPERGVVIANHEGNDEAYAWNAGDRALRKVSDSGTAVLEAVIRPDGASIVYHRDTTGSEFGHLHEVPFGGGPAVDLTPAMDPYVAYLLRASGTVLVAAIATDTEQSVLGAGHGEPLIMPAEGVVQELVLAPDGSRVAIAEAMDGLYTRTILRSTADGTEIDRLDLSTPGAINRDRVAVGLHRGGWLRPGIWTAGGAVELIEVDLPGDVRPVDWSPDGRRMLLSQWYRGTGALAWFDPQSQDLTPLARPDGTPGQSQYELHGDAATVIWSDAHRPWGVWEIGPASARPILSVAVPDSYPGARWENVELRSDDGTGVQAWFLRPEGKGPWPAVLYGHGGPTYVATPGFSPICQAWVDSGYALLSVNYRGSTTFGDDYREALTRHIGEVDVADMMAGREWLATSGLVDPSRIIVNGYSYGGYLALQCPALHPGAFAAAIAGAPITDWLLMGEDQNAILDAYDRALFGGDRTETAELHRAASPRTYVDRFDTPVLITTPSQDTRTPLRPVQAFVDDMRAAGKQVRLDLLEGGHAGIGSDQEIRMMESWIEFARDVTG